MNCESSLLDRVLRVLKPQAMTAPQHESRGKSHSRKIRLNPNSSLGMIRVLDHFVDRKQPRPYLCTTPLCLRRIPSLETPPLQRRESCFHLHIGDSELPDQVHIASWTSSTCCACHVSWLHHPLHKEVPVLCAALTTRSLLILGGRAIRWSSTVCR